MDKQQSHWPLIALLCVFGLLTLAFSIFVPIFEASDELWHYPMVEVIARTWQLPVQPLEPGQSTGPWRQEASQPPLYYGIGALLTSWIDTSDMEQVRHLNPHTAAGEVTTDHNNANLIGHIPSLEHFPWSGTTLAVHIVRLFSVVLGIWSVYLTWLLVRELYPDRPTIAWLTAAIQGFTPMYMFITSSVNNDNLVIPLSTLAMLLMVRHVKKRSPDTQPDKGTTHPLIAYLTLGTVIALAILTKYGAITLLPLAAAVAAWDAWTKLAPQWYKDRKLPLRALGYFVIRLMVIVLPSILIAGWWFYRNFRLYNDWLGLNAFYAVLGTRDVEASWAQLWSERFSFMAGYWGNFGGLNVPMPDWIYHTLNTVAIMAIVSVAIAFIRWLIGDKHENTQPVAKRVNPFQWEPLTAARALSWAWAAAVLISWSQWATITWSSQGRLIFSSLPMWALGLAIGLSNLLPKTLNNKQHIPAGVFTGGLLVLCIIALPVWIVPMYNPGATSAMASEAPLTPLDLTFGNSLQLKGYHLAQDTIEPGGTLSLELEWEALQPMPTDHSLFIHIVGQGGRIVAQRDSFPNRGLVPTTQLQSGQTWRERYDFHFAPMTYAPDQFEFTIGLYETYTGVRQPIKDESGASLGDTVFVGSASIKPADAPQSLEMAFGTGIKLNAYDVSSLIVAPGEQLNVSLDWECLESMDTDYTFSLQLIDSNWNKVAQSDSWPLNGDAPTTTWQVSNTYSEERRLTVSPDAPSAVFDLMLTIYYQQDDGTITHLPIVWQTGQMPAERVKLTNIRVK